MGFLLTENCKILVENEKKTVGLVFMMKGIVQILAFPSAQKRGISQIMKYLNYEVILCRIYFFKFDN